MRAPENVFNIRASYADEADKAVQHLATIGIRRIAVVYQNNAFGKEVFDSARQAIAEAKLPAALNATVEMTPPTPPARQPSWPKAILKRY